MYYILTVIFSCQEAIILHVQIRGLPSTVSKYKKNRKDVTGLSSFSFDLELTNRRYIINFFTFLSPFTNLTHLFFFFLFYLSVFRNFYFFLLFLFTFLFFLISAISFYFSCYSFFFHQYSLLFVLTVLFDFFFYLTLYGR